MIEYRIDRVLRMLDPIGCVLDAEGIIQEVSSGWKKAAEQNGLRVGDYGVGTNYLKHCIHGEGSSSLGVYRGLTRVLSRKTSFFGTVYPCAAPGGPPRWFLMAAVPSSAANNLVNVFHLDLSHAPGIGAGEPSNFSEPNDHLLQTIRRALREELTRQEATEAGINLEDGKLLGKLNNKQMRLLQLLSRGYSNAQIAEELRMPLSSAKSNTAALIRLLGFANRTQAALFGARAGLDRGHLRSGRQL